MPTVDQMLRTAARAHQGTPYWILEKDYALGYLLAGIAQVEALQAVLVLKGGTALRKFYFAGYRFSERIDCALRASIVRELGFLELFPVAQHQAGRSMGLQVIV